MRTRYETVSYDEVLREREGAAVIAECIEVRTGGPPEYPEVTIRDIHRAGPPAIPVHLIPELCLVLMAAVSGRPAPPDPWQPNVAAWLPARPVTISEVLADCLAVPAHKRHQGDKIRVARILVALGRTRRRLGPRGARQWAYQAT